MANQTLESNIVVHHIDGNKMNNSQMQQWASDIFTKGQQSMEVAPVQQLP